MHWRQVLFLKAHLYSAQPLSEALLLSIDLVEDACCSAKGRCSRQVVRIIYRVGSCIDVNSLSSSCWRRRNRPLQQPDGLALSLLKVALTEQYLGEYLIGHGLVVRQRLQMLGERRGHLTLVSQVSVNRRRC